MTYIPLTRSQGFMAHLSYVSVIFAKTAMKGSGGDREQIPSHVICLSQSEAENREQIGSGSGADPSDPLLTLM